MSYNGLTVLSVADLLRETGRAHKEAYKNVNGNDADWPLWFSEHLQKPMNGLFNMEFTRSQLIYCLMSAEKERHVAQPDSDWPRFYAEYFVTRYSESETSNKDQLALYIIPACPYCKMVRNAIDKLEVEVELRDITTDPAHRQELMDERKRTTVPVLRITSPEGDSRWMPESQDIVQYLQKTYG